MYFLFRYVCVFRFVQVDILSLEARGSDPMDVVWPPSVAAGNSLGPSGPSFQPLFLIINMVLPSFSFLPSFRGAGDQIQALSRMPDEHSANNLSPNPALVWFCR